MNANDGVRLPGPVAPGTVPQPALNGAPVPLPVARPKPQAEQPAVKDAFREVVETIVFVIVLVLLLKTFVAEAFVIPTGSMAETLLGYQKWVKCEQCGYEFPVNCSSEADPQQGPPVDVIACTCPNCRYKEVWRDRDLNSGALRTPTGGKGPPSWGSGDRVLVSKFPYDDGHLDRPKRFNVIVFKYPMEPQKGQTPMNYIKRLCGLPGETIAIYDGDLYIYDPAKANGEKLEYPPETHARPEDPKDLWRIEYTYYNDPAALEAWRTHKFTILRKSPDLILAMRRIVYDNDHQADDLVGKVPPRWQAQAGWSADNKDAPKVFRQAGDSGPDVQWLRYKHLMVERSNLRALEVPANPTPQLIKNFMGYNTGETADGRGNRAETNWVGDLILDCSAQVEALQGELTLELSKGSERFQARFNLQDGSCTLWRLGDAKELARAEKVITKTGRYSLRFANVDHRLTVWVDGKLPFQDPNDKEKAGVDYTADRPDPDNANNLEPASIGVSGAAKVSVSHLQLWRDTYYTPYTDHSSSNDDVRTMYVQPGHYLCLGDNSSESSDSRYWGLVPQRLLLGRALVVYYPFGRAGLIR
jgi:signal peptidase I